MRRALLPLPLVLVVACSNGGSAPIGPGLDAEPDALDAFDGDAADDVDVADVSDATDATDTAETPAPSDWCALPGSVQFTASGVVTIPGGSPTAPSLAYLHLPTGFCAHHFGNVGNARQLRFAPGGELFVASPTTSTTGGGPNGESAIVVLPDDDHDGVADAPITFMGMLPSTQGLMFVPGWFYFQDGTKIMRVAYASGDRQPSGAPELVADITIYTSTLHWPKAFDVADDGTIYVGNGGDQGETCVTPHPFHGGILKLDGAPGGTPVAQGLRNPIAVRCARGHDRCFALELSKDYSATQGGREKMIPIRAGDDWGFPCCASQDLPYPGISPVPDCSGVTPESVSFVIGDTPFGLAFAPSTWPTPWAGQAIVTTHGAAGSWTGARVVGIEMDPTTGLPKPGTNVGGTNTGSMSDFATGWDDGTHLHGRPAAVELAADGRLFLSNDTNGDILWIAPMKP